ncbi:MAG: hypothetical protein GQ570_00775, partial [Helicobacteraceae bacterium]|nr:hypothetical protein [Helicobacteraceae bacterium]
MKDLNLNSEDKIYITPYTDSTIELKEYIENKFNIKIEGFIDKSKKGENIYNQDRINHLNIDKLLIFSQNYQFGIYNDLKPYILSSKLKLIFRREDDYKEANIHCQKLIHELISTKNAIVLFIITYIFQILKLKVSWLWINRIGEQVLSSDIFLSKLKLNKISKK